MKKQQAKQQIKQSINLITHSLIQSNSNRNMSDTSTKPACAVDMPVNLPEKDAPSTHSHEGVSHGHGGVGGSHGHTHEAMENPGVFEHRDAPIMVRDLKARAFTVGIGGPVGSG
jgi:hypothetical protein